MAEPVDPERRKSFIARLAAIAAVLIAIVVVGFMLFGGDGDGYRVKAEFQNAGQLVKGNLVQVGGTKGGTVEGFEITPGGLAKVELAIDDRYAPLPAGTRAVIRQGSQSSVAARYVDLHFPPENGRDEKLPDGGLLGIDKTTTGVDFDQFLNIFDPPTRKALRGFYRGGQAQYAGRGDQANRGLHYLSPALSSSSRLFSELNYDPPVLERFLVNSSRFVTALAERRDDLSALVDNLNRTTRALGGQKEALAELIGRFPDFMRTANTTYVNLRATLDDVDPFVEASKPVARRLGPYLDELRPFARDARPTVRDLSRVVGRKGKDNDLRDLNRTYPILTRIALDTRKREVDAGAGPVSVGSTRGAFPEITEALKESAPIIAHGRPYTPDLFGWFDDFSHTGAYDALGSFSRSLNNVNAFSLTPNAPPVPICGIPAPLDLTPLTCDAQSTSFKQLAKTEQFKRCPGGAEEAAPDGSNVLSAEEQQKLDCVESHRATGPKQ